MTEQDPAAQAADPTALAVKGMLDAHFEQVSGLINDALKAFDEAPALKNSGFITPDGGSADPQVKTFADFLKAIQRGDTKRLETVYGSVKSLNGDTGASGGFLVPPQFVPNLMEVAGEQAIIRPRAYVQPMASRTMTIPALDQTRSYSAGHTAYTGGVQMTWTSEEASITEQSAYFKEVNLEAWKLAGITYVSNELNSDSAIGVDALLTRLFGTTIGYEEDYAFLQGDGVGKPLGIINAPATVTSGSSTVTATTLEGMIARLFPDSMSRAIWIAHITLLPTIYALQAANNVLVTFLPDLRGAPGKQLFGLPLYFTDKVPSGSTTGKVLLVDPSYYVIGDRSAIQIAMSEHAAFTTDRTAWRVTHRVDGQPWLQAAVQITSSSSDALSAFVAHGG